MKRAILIVSTLLLALLLALPVEAKKPHPCANGNHKGDKHCVATATAIPTLTPTPTRRCPQYTPTPAPGGGGGGGYPCP